MKKYTNTFSQQRSGVGCGKSSGCQTRGSAGPAGGHGRPGDLILSPIEDVSPSVEAAEQESMSRIQVGPTTRQPPKSIIFPGKIELFRL